jgi:iron complex transport system substrate-binding protein
VRLPPVARDRRIVSTSALPEGLSSGQIDAVVSARIAAGEDLYRLDEGALSDLDPDVVLTQDLCAVCTVDVDRLDDALAHLGCAAQVVTLPPDPGCGPRLHSRSRDRARRGGRGHRTHEPR